MKVTLDQDKCVASGQCVVAAGDVFDQRDEDGIAVLLNPNPRPNRPPTPATPRPSAPHSPSTSRSDGRSGPLPRSVPRMRPVPRMRRGQRAGTLPVHHLV